MNDQKAQLIWAISREAQFKLNRENRVSIVACIAAVSSLVSFIAPADPPPAKIPTFRQYLSIAGKSTKPFTPNPKQCKGLAGILDMMIAIVALVVAILLGTFLLIPRDPKAGRSKNNQSSDKKGANVYSKAEVSLHNKRTDCWIIIKYKVYDVTSYVEEHPGGDAILANAGDDSTEGFYGPQHATRVFDMIDDFYIGDLEQQLH